MREYILEQAQSRQPYGGLSMLVRVVKNWRARREMRHLASLDDYLLRDIGLSREELRALMRAPLTLDVQWEAERLERLSAHEPGRR